MKSRIALEATLLIVDDDEDLLEMSAAKLESQFGGVLCSSNPLEAVRIAQTNSIDLAILDFQMPKLNGLELLTELRRNQPKLPALLLTAHGSDPKVLEAIQSGVIFDLVDKPYRFENLMNRARNALLQPFLWNLLWVQAGQEAKFKSHQDWDNLSLDQQEEWLYRLSAVLRMRKVA
jgi:DNA-binding response OmpR family regulator